MTNLLVIPVSALLLVSGSANPTVAPSTRGIELSLTGDEAAGHVRLAWALVHEPTAASTPEFQVEQATDPQFENAEVRYQGPHQSSFFSGLTNGDYYYRVRARDGPSPSWRSWSPPAHFRVEHHSPTTAGTLFSLGALVLVITGLVLLRESRKAK